MLSTYYDYGPYHCPEKLIPLVMHNVFSGKPLPIYSDGQQVRDALYMKDHHNSICHLLKAGHLGGTYNVGRWKKPT